MFYMLLYSHQCMAMCIKRAHKFADCEPSTMGYISAISGTTTLHGDCFTVILQKPWQKFAL